MTVTVNGVEIPELEIERELIHHTEAPMPREAAIRALVVRELLLQEARRIGVSGHDAEDDGLIDALLAQEVHVPQPTEQECHTYYRQNRRRFRTGDLVEASHILFQVVRGTPVEAIRTRAEAVLGAILVEPTRFEEFARRFSNCPSGASGGMLGQLSRGQTVPEFEVALFALAPGCIRSTLLPSRFGFHILRVMRRVEGQLLAFEAVKERIANYLVSEAGERATAQYVKILVGQADIGGAVLEGAATPLVQ